MCPSRDVLCLYNLYFDVFADFRYMNHTLLIYLRWLFVFAALSKVNKAFSLPNGGGSERNREGFGSKDVEEVKSGGGRITGEQRFDVEIST